MPTDEASPSECHIYGEVPRQGAEWPASLVQALQVQGLSVDQNVWCVRVSGCSHFKFELTADGALVEADEDTPEQMLADAWRVSEAPTNAGLRHRFEVYRHTSELAYLHHDWPRPVAK